MAFSIIGRTSLPFKNTRLLCRSRSSEPEFGILFDIDGVICRGKKVLPCAPEAFKKLVDNQGKFRVPAVFLTNAGNTTRQSKADLLSGWLGVKITEDQVVMAHSPLRMFHEYHNKHVLVVGQGPVADIAANNGFNNVTTVSQLRHAFPSLDAVDHKRRRAPPCSFEEYFPRLEAVVLFGEPIRWETSLQLIIDVLMTNGKPNHASKTIHYPHIPLLACNMDLQWMAEAVLPRFGHGAFLICLENLYKKITGKDLVYNALIGKPSELTYIYADQILQAEAAKIGLTSQVKNVYCIGDNICTDIFGANLYDRYLSNINEMMVSRQQTAALSSKSNRCRTFDSFTKSTAQRCLSILVETGVYCPGDDIDSQVLLNHSPRDFLPVEMSEQEPKFRVNNVLEAVNLILEKEKL